MPELHFGFLGFFAQIEDHICNGEQPAVNSVVLSINILWIFNEKLVWHENFRGVNLLKDTKGVIAFRKSLTEMFIHFLQANLFDKKNTSIFRSKGTFSAFHLGVVRVFSHPQGPWPLTTRRLPRHNMDMARLQTGRIIGPTCCKHSRKKGCHMSTWEYISWHVRIGICKIKVFFSAGSFGNNQTLDLVRSGQSVVLVYVLWGMLVVRN